MAQFPEISYTHVLSELSVNRKDPCEIIRELISNSYDAEASIIEIYPLLQSQYQGFIFFDNGIGLSKKKMLIVP
jgi:DNA mismatch repair ATPase MutL